MEREVTELKIQTEKGVNLSAELRDAVIRFRRLAFMQGDKNAAIFPDTCDLLSKQDLLGQREINQDDLDAMDSGDLPERNGVKALVLRGRNRIFSMMGSYLSRETSRVTMLKNRIDQIEGVVIGCSLSLEELFEEEFAREYSYTDIPLGERRGSVSFFKKLSEESGGVIERGSIVCFLSNIILEKQRRNKGYGTLCMSNYLKSLEDVPEDERGSYIIFDTNVFDQFPIIHRTPGVRRVKGFLENSDLVVAPYGEALKLAYN